MTPYQDAIFFATYLIKMQNDESLDVTTLQKSDPWRKRYRTQNEVPFLETINDQGLNMHRAYMPRAQLILIL